MEGFWAGIGTGIAIGNVVSGTVRPSVLDIVDHSHQLEEAHKHRVKSESLIFLNIYYKRC